MEIKLFNPFAGGVIKSDKEKKERATRIANAVRHGNTALVRKEMRSGYRVLSEAKLAKAK